MLNLNMTIGELLKGVKESHAEIAQFIAQEENGDPRYAIIVLMGKETTQEVLNAIKKLGEYADE